MKLNLNEAPSIVVLIFLVIKLLKIYFSSRLERSMGENGLIDRSGCTLKMEPLASVRQLERFLLKMVAKQWYG